MKLLRFVAYLSTSLILFSSCSSIQKIAIGQTGQIVYKASFDQQAENDWDMFEKSLVSNIKLLESFLSQDPTNEDLLVSLIKAYSAKGYAIDETYYLADKYQDNEDSIHRKNAMIAYTRALDLGARYLKANGIPETALSDYVSKPEELTKILTENLDDDLREIEAVVYIGQALGGLINLQKTNMRAIGYVPVMKTLFDWSCKQRPDLAYGLCDIFYATYDSSRPAMLGGNPLEGKRKFMAAVDKWSENLLVRVSFIEHYIIPMIDDAQYRLQKIELDSSLAKIEESKIWDGGVISPASKNYNNIYNMIAAKRMSIIKKYEDDIF
jgi:hypothetical protein